MCAFAVLSFGLAFVTFEAVFNWVFNAKYPKFLGWFLFFALFGFLAFFIIGGSSFIIFMWQVLAYGFFGELGVNALIPFIFGAGTFVVMMHKLLSA